MNQENKKIAKRYEHYVCTKDKHRKALIQHLATNRPELQNLISAIDKKYKKDENELEWNSILNTVNNSSFSNKLIALFFSLTILLILRVLFNFANPPSVILMLQSLPLYEQNNISKLESWLYAIIFMVYLTFSWLNFLVSINQLQSFDFNPFIMLLRTAIFTAVVLYTMEIVGTFLIG